MIAGAALVSSPIIIHLINRMRFRRVPWAAMEFLLKSQKRNRRRRIIEQIILLLLRITLVLLVGLLLARFISDALAFVQPQSTVHVVVLDDSASMGDAWRIEGERRRDVRCGQAGDRGGNRAGRFARADAAIARRDPLERFELPASHRADQRRLRRGIALGPGRLEADRAAPDPHRRRPQGEGTLRSLSQFEACAACGQRFPCTAIGPAAPRKAWRRRLARSRRRRAPV